jgi:protein SCO1/2
MSRVVIVLDFVLVLALALGLALVPFFGAQAQPAAPGPPPRPAPPAQTLPPALEGVGFDQRLGERLPLDVHLRDEHGRAVPIGAYFTERPVVLAFVYYECPMLCTLVLNGLTSALKAVPFSPGRDFEIVTVSFDPRDTPALAARKKEHYVAALGAPAAAAGWHFLTGDSAAVRTLTEAAGFRYTYDAERGEFAHASGLLVLTPDGVISRVLYGIEYAPKDVRLALVEAGEGKVGSFVDQLLLFCFHYDPAAGQYGAAVLNLIRAGGLLMLAGLAGFVLVSLRRDRRARAGAAGLRGGAG